MLSQLSEVFFFFNTITAKITQKIVMGNAAWWYLLDKVDIFVISLTQENICDLTLSLPECLIEFCKVNVTFESADKILCCACMATQMKALCLYFHRKLFLFQLSQKEIWKFGQNLLLAKFGSKHIIDQKQQHPCDIAPFSTRYKPVHSVMSKTDEETNKTKQNNDFEYFTYTTSIAIVHNLLKRGNKPRAHCVSIPEYWTIQWYKRLIKT